MGEFLSAGVFVEEVASSTQVVGPVSTSNMAIVSWTPQGPTDTATLVTSFDQYTKTFGGFDRRSYGAYAVAAFFANGGRRCYQVRVTPDDAVAAGAKIISQETDQTIGAGDGTTVAFAATSGTTTLRVASGAAPIVPGSLTIRWRAAGTPVATQATKKRDGTTTQLAVISTLKYEGTINPASLPAVDPHLWAIAADGTVALQWTSSSASKSVSVANPTGGSSIGVGTNGAGSTASVDFRTGRYTLLIANAETPDAANITASFTPASVTKSLTDDGAGALPAGAILTGAGSINYTTGAYSFTTVSGSKPHNLSPILATYKINAWTLAPVSAGVWGNDLKMQITGSANFFTTATQSYSRYNVLVLQTDANGNDNVKETYEDLDFSDPTSPFFFAGVVTEFSSLLKVTTPGGDRAPQQLDGIPFSLVLCGGDDSDTGRLVQRTLPTQGLPIGKRTVVISFTDSNGTARTIKDDGKGNLTGDIDPTYTGGAANTINYSTGVLDFKTLAVAGPAGIKANTLLSISWYAAPAETTHEEDFGDTVKGYTVGTDGTFDSTHFGTLQFTDFSLSSDYRGVYALDRVDEIMQVIVPDFAGDVTASKDLLTYASVHANQASGGDKFIILSVPKGSSATDAVDWFRNKLSSFSNYAALYWPWIVVSDPLANNRKITIPPVGHIAGIYARTDVNRNVGKSPGGTVDGQLSYALDLETSPTQGERDTVYPNRINPLIKSPQTGMAVWGVRTISQDSTWKYINARRLFMFLEKSIYNSIFWTVFENNGPALWARVKAQLEGFLLALFNDGYFAGTTPAQAFFVIVDETNNSQESIAQGQLIVDVGVAPNKPAEFVRVRFAQKTLT